MEETNRSVIVALQEEAIVAIENRVTLKARDVQADEDASVDVEETNVAAQCRVARVKPTALRKHRPLPRVKARVNHAAAKRARSGGTPVLARSPKPDVVQQVTSENSVTDQLDHINMERRPGTVHLVGICSCFRICHPLKRNGCISQVR